MTNGWIGVDLDGTLAYYDQWRGALHIGEPIPVMLERVKRWLDEGKDVRIFTARVNREGIAFGYGKWGGHARRNGCRRVHSTMVCEACRSRASDYLLQGLWNDRAMG